MNLIDAAVTAAFSNPRYRLNVREFRNLSFVEQGPERPVESAHPDQPPNGGHADIVAGTTAHANGELLL